MSVANKLLQAAAGNAGGEGEYVDDLFSTYLYEGNGSTQTITNGIDLDGEGGLVWIKDRSAAFQHRLYDTERGATKSISSHDTSAEFTISDGLTAFNEGGFSLGSSSTHNASGNDYVSWTFRKQPGFFDVVTYTGNGTAGRTVSHNLGSVPGCIIIKAYSGGASGSQNWPVWHTSLANTETLFLNLTGAKASVGSGYWNSTSPSDTEFSLGSANAVNGTGMTYVAYLFAHDAQDFGTDSDESIIKCGSFTGTASGEVTVNLGWEPQFIIYKLSNNTNSGDDDNWRMHDVMRGWDVTNRQLLNPNASAAEQSLSNTSGYEIKPTATGFIHEGHAASSGSDYVYVAIRRPHKPASEFAATDLFAIDTKNSTNAAQPNFFSEWPVDFALRKQINNSSIIGATTRLLGEGFLRTNDTDALVSSADWATDYSNGWFNDVNTTPDTNNQSWMFRRAPGFFDVVAYSGDNTTNQQVSHNLGAVPELMILKLRNSASGWPVYTSATGAAGFLLLNNTAAYQTGSYWGTSGGTAPTATNVTVDGSGNNSGIDYILYLFATVPGISKVGSYTGTGSDVDVDCGFASGARFVLVKRTDSTGDWYVWDSERGIVAGNDPYLLLNSDAAQVTNTDYIDPLSSGFTITSSAPAALNASGGTYIFLAIA